MISGYVFGSRIGRIRDNLLFRPVSKRRLEKHSAALRKQSGRIMP
ncbi:hypothetical protein E1H18_2429 [Caulobacter sp. RHG1]|nr:hypothetical protein [Caulobacter sp. RHG1]